MINKLNRAILLGGGGVILILAITLRINFLEQKLDAHVDEILSIILSEYNEYGWGKVFEENKVITPDEAKSAILWNDSSLSGAFKDVYKLWKNNRDDPHTNFYYTLLRLWHIGYTDTNLQHIFYRGASLNILFFIIGFYFAYRIALRFQYNYMVLLFLSIAFLNPASINNTLFMRPYALQEMLFLVFCYGFICTFDKLKLDYHKYNSWRYRVLFGFLTALLLSSGYFGSLFVFMAFFYATLWELKHFKPIKKYKMFFPISSIIAILFCIALYPKYFRGFRGSRGSEAGEKLNFDYFKESILNNIDNFTEILSFNLSWIVLIITALGLCLAILYRNKLHQTNNNLIVFLGICAFIWAFAVIYVAPYKTLRYIMPVFPIFLLLMPYAVNTINNVLSIYNINKTLKNIIIVAICIASVYSIFPKDKSKITFVNYGIANSQPTRDTNQMVVIILQAAYLYANIIPYLNTNMIFLNDCKKLPNVIAKYRRIELITDENKCNLDTYDIKPFWHAGGLNSMIVKEK